MEMSLSENNGEVARYFDFNGPALPQRNLDRVRRERSKEITIPTLPNSSFHIPKIYPKLLLLTLHKWSQCFIEVVVCECGRGKV